MTGRRETLTLQPDVLRWARERADFSVDALAQKVGVKAERVLGWENAGAISMPQAEKLARATHTPLGYLFLSFPARRGTAGTGFPRPRRRNAGPPQR